MVAVPERDVHAAVVTFRDPDSGPRDWMLTTAEKLLLAGQRAVAPCHNYPVELSLFQEGRLRVTKP